MAQRLFNLRLLKYLFFLTLLMIVSFNLSSQSKKYREMKVDSLISDLAKIDTVYLIAGGSQIDLYRSGSVSDDALILKGIVKYLGDLKLSVQFVKRSEIISKEVSLPSKVLFDYEIKEQIFGMGSVYIPMSFKFITPEKTYQFNTKMFVYTVTDFAFESYNACKKYFYYEKGSSKPKRFQVKYF